MIASRLPRRLGLSLLSLLALVAASAAGAGEIPLNDVRNPRNVRFEGRVIPFVGDSRRLPLAGEPPTWPPRSEVRWMLGDLGPPEPRVRAGSTQAQWNGADGAAWTLDGRPREPREERNELTLGDGSKMSMVATYVPWVAEAGRHVLVATTQDDRCVTLSDALRVLLLVERTTHADGTRRFGSFPRRFRKSLDDLHALFAASVYPAAPQGLVDRYRIVDGVVYRRADGPERFGLADHPAADVAVACDQGGPRTGAFLRPHAIGWTAADPESDGDLWSATGEQTLWRDLLRLRGVPEFRRYAAAAGALPGRTPSAIPLPARYATDLMASPAQTPRLSELTVLLANANAGLSDVGDPDDTADGRYGRTWRWLPPRVDVVVSDGGSPASGAVVRWWRSMPIPTLPLATPQGVAADRAPDGEATADATGRVSIVGDYLGSRAAAVSQRGLWLLVEVDRAGAKRFEIVYGLDLNLAYARGDKFFTTVRLDLASMLVPGGEIPKTR